MKRNQIIWTCLLAAGVFAPVGATAQFMSETAAPSGARAHNAPVVWNEPPLSEVNPWTQWPWMRVVDGNTVPVRERLSFSARFGLNISAKFSGVTPIAIPPISRTTPNNDLYNYDNGYVRPDINAVEYGNNDGLTWYVGYDNYNGQPSPNDQVDEATHSLLFSRSAGPATLRAPSMDDDPTPGAELTYTHELGAGEHFRFGFEAAANYLSIGLRAHDAYALRGPVENHAYSYHEGTTPPTATPDDPYLGAYQWGNFTIFSDYTALPNTEASVGTVTGNRSLDANLWGGRLGPYAEFNLSSNVCVS
jgi:hypothetical protein